MPLQLRHLHSCLCRSVPLPAHARRADATASILTPSASMLAVATSLLAVVLAGCATSTSSTSTPTVTSPSANALTGNWQATATPTAGSPVTAIAGSVSEDDGTSDAGQYTTADLQFTGPCFTASPLLPLQGYLKSGALSLNSYTVNGQAVNMAATSNAAGTGLQGSYSVQGGCASGATGSFTATRYAPLLGTYAGTAAMAGAPAVQTKLSLTQATDPTGSGTFLLTGTATLSGTGCALQASAVAAAGNAVRGNTAALVLNATDGSGGTLTVSGTFDSAAAAFSPQVFTVTGGGCAGSYSSTPLAR